MRTVLVACLALYCAAAAAQLRVIPQDAMVGTIRHVEAMAIELDGAKAQLAPGAQIRDADNRLVVPASLRDSAQVRYLVDGMGHVYRVWMLSDVERENLPKPPSPFPK